MDNDKQNKEQWQPWVYRNKFARFIVTALILGGLILTISDLIQGRGISINPGTMSAIVAYMFYLRWREKRGHAKGMNTADDLGSGKNRPSYNGWFGKM